MDIKISVIIPAYNRSKTILRCLYSVINQSYQPYEMIVVDDGSCDDTIDVIKKIQDERIVLLSQNHKGAQAARNLGIKKAKGNYIAFLDSDDEWLPFKLEQQCEVLSQNNNAIVHTDSYIFNDESGGTNGTLSAIECIEKGMRIKEYHVPETNGNVYSALLTRPAPMFPGLIMKKEALEKIGYLDERVPAYQEWDTCIRLSKYYEFVHLRTPQFIYHFHNYGSISENPKKDINGYAYIVNKNKNNILRECGRAVLKNHYENLIEKCITSNDSRYMKYYFNWIFS